GAGAGDQAGDRGGAWGHDRARERGGPGHARDGHAAAAASRGYKESVAPARVEGTAVHRSEPFVPRTYAQIEGTRPGVPTRQASPTAPLGRAPGTGPIEAPPPPPPEAAKQKLATDSKAGVSGAAQQAVAAPGAGPRKLEGFQPA